MWKPILEGTLRNEALAAIDAVGSSLLCKPGSHKVDGSLASGAAGLAIFYAYLARAREEHRYEKVALALLRKAAAAVSTSRMDRSLYDGFAGVGWAIAHLRGWLIDRTDRSTRSIDRVLLNELSKSPWNGDYDLISGLVGFGVYALEQLPRARAIRCLREIISRLGEIAESKPEGITWFKGPSLLGPAQRKKWPQGYYDFGLAHGVPGIIAFLASVQFSRRDLRGLKDAATRSGRMLDGAVSWLLAQRLKRRRDSVFPYSMQPGAVELASRVAWCYGDLSIALALLIAGLAAKNRHWRNEALRLAKEVARRPGTDSLVTDCGLCHGAAGVAHLFNRTYQATRENLFRTATRDWCERTLAMRRQSRAAAGFFAMQKGRDERWKPAAESGLLRGAAGVALALAAAATAIEPNWDRLLLISLPRPSLRNR